MPSPFEQQLAAQMPTSLYAAFGVSASYQAPNSDAVASGLIVRLHRDDPHQMPTAGGGVAQMQTAELLVMPSPALGRPVKGGRFTVDGHGVWTLTDEPKSQNAQFVCRVKRAGDERLASRKA